MIPLIEAKAHLRVTSSAEDALIEDMIATAEQHLASIGIDMTVDPLPAPLKQAALLLVAHLFEVRGTVEGDARLSPVFLRLVAPYREIAL